MKSYKLSIYIASAITVMSAVLLGCAPAKTAGLTFTDGGEVVGVGGRIAVSEGGDITISTASGDTYSLTVPTIVKGGKTFWTAGGLSNRALHVDDAKKETDFTATINDPALPAPIPIQYSLSLSPEGKARITLRYDSSEPISKLLGLDAIFFYTQRAPAVGSEVNVDGVVASIPDAALTDHATLLTKRPDPKDISFYSNDPFRTVTAHVVQATDVRLSDENLHAWQSLGLRLFPVDNTVVVDVDLPQKAKPVSPETYAGFDFYDAEHLHMPEYGQSRNLVQNPSFEQGFQSWTFGNLGKDHYSRFPDSYVIDTTDPRSGRKCVKFLVESGERPAPIASFPIPVEPGKDYTLSFYAKADQPGVVVDTTIFGSGDAGWSPNWKSLAIGTTWKRYSYVFKVLRSATSVEFGVSAGATDVVAFLDDVQFEKGPLTDFTCKPLGMSFVTDQRGNLFRPGEPIHGRWTVNGPAGATGKMVISEHDYLGALVKTSTAPFKLSANGTATVPFPWVENTPRGLYTEEAVATLDTGFATREYGRLAIMPPADPSVKHHTLFATGGMQSQDGSWNRIMDHLEYFGMGSMMNFDPPPHPVLTMMAKHHLTNVTSIFDSGDHFGDIHLKDGWSGNEADLPIIEADAYAKAKAYPEITYWKLVNEPGGDLVSNVNSMKRWIRALTAAYRGIKRANPAAHVISIDPANIEPNSGTAMVNNFLQCGGGAICDIAAIHPYCAVPDGRDLDFATFMAMLNRNNFHGDVWFTEGGDFCDVNVPGMVTGNDNWRAGLFSYDIGDGERRTAAYESRLWLVGLKYGSRVKQQVDWSYENGTMDYDETPKVRAFSSNTLSGILGNADYVQDVTLGPDVYCYMFVDPQHRPVAVLWNPIRFNMV